MVKITALFILGCMFFGLVFVSTWGVGVLSLFRPVFHALGG